MEFSTLNSKYNKNISFNGIRMSELNAIQKRFVHDFSINPQNKAINSAVDIDNIASDIFEKKYIPNTGFIGKDESLKPFKDALNPKTNEFFKKNPTLATKCCHDMQDSESGGFLPIMKIEPFIKTVNETFQYLMETDGKCCIDFKARYQNNVLKDILNKYFPNEETPSGWVRVEKINKDAKDSITKTKIQDLASLSVNTFWCTKNNIFAEECLIDGDFFVLIRDGIAKLAVRTKEFNKNHINDFGIENLGLKNGDLYTTEIKDSANIVSRNFNEFNDSFSEFLNTSEKKYGKKIAFYTNDIRDWYD